MNIVGDPVGDHLRKLGQSSVMVTTRKCVPVLCDACLVPLPLGVKTFEMVEDCLGLTQINESITSGMYDAPSNGLRRRVEWVARRVPKLVRFAECGLDETLVIFGETGDELMEIIYARCKRDPTNGAEKRVVGLEVVVVGGQGRERCGGIEEYRSQYMGACTMADEV